MVLIAYDACRPKLECVKTLRANLATISEEIKSIENSKFIMYPAALFLLKAKKSELVLLLAKEERNARAHFKALGLIGDPDFAPLVEELSKETAPEPIAPAPVAMIPAPVDGDCARADLAVNLHAGEGHVWTGANIHAFYEALLSLPQGDRRPYNVHREMVVKRCPVSSQQVQARFRRLGSAGKNA